MIRSTCYHRGMHLEAEEIASRHACCPFCGEVRSEALFPVQKNPSVMLLRCSNCTAVYADAVPSSELLDRYYAKYYSSEERSVTCASPRKFARRIFRSIGAVTSGPIRILDFGGGDGSIAYALAEMLLEENSSSVELHIVDYCEHPVSSADGRITVSRSAELNGACGKFDIVMASAVLEHLPFPGEAIRRLLSRVAPGGCFYARHPWIVPMMSAARRFGIAIDFTFPGHLSDFGGGFWLKFIDHAGMKDFTVSCSRPSPVESGFAEAPLRTLASFAMKTLWHLTFGAWTFVGGWEAVLKRKG